MNEYQVKAAFIYNFTSFVEWPPNSLGDKNKPFVIGVLGKDPFGNFLKEIVQGESVHGHPIVIRNITDTDPSDCNILFVSPDAREVYRGHLEKIQKSSILTVSDDEDFLKNGGMIYLYNDNNKIRLQINVDQASKAGLTISSKLLRLASIYKK